MKNSSEHLTTDFKVENIISATPQKTYLVMDQVQFRAGRVDSLLIRLKELKDRHPNCPSNNFTVDGNTISCSYRTRNERYDLEVAEFKSERRGDNVRSRKY